MRPTEGRPGLVVPPGRTTVLLVEDDDGDAVLVHDLLEIAAPELTVRRARSIGDALHVLAGVDCVLLDLGLPDSTGLAGLERLAAAAPHLAVLVLTGLVDEHRGVAAVTAGAQDYLVKDEIEGNLLARAVRYAIERKRADETRRRLLAAELQAVENRRLERNLLPLPLVTSADVGLVSRYRPGRHSLLGGDFYDVVECEDGRIFGVIGDVAGHGPDEAALGVALRIAWRTLVLATGIEADVILPSLEHTLVAERRAAEIFATVCMVELAADRASARLWLAGHPRPLLVDGTSVDVVTAHSAGPALGMLADQSWKPAEVDLGPGSSLLLYTDGLVEERIAGTSDRLGDAGLRDLVAGLRADHASVESLVDAVIHEVSRLTDAAANDDRAILVLTTPAGT